MLIAAWAKVGAVRYPLTEEEPFSFGRGEDCTVVLGRGDVTVSRLAGSVEYDKQAWWLVNRSNIRALTIVDELGFRNVLPPRRRIVLDSPVTAVVDALNTTYRVEITVPRTAGHPPEQHPLDGTRTSIADGVLINEADRLAMVALFADYLAPMQGRHSQPRPYAAAAAQLGWPKTTLIKQVEYLCKRLANVGVPNLTGWTALPALAEYAISGELITKADLALIEA